MKMKLKMKSVGSGSPEGFTLIELLTVIAIIGVLAGITVMVSGLAKAKMREGRVKGEHQRLVTAIEAYKAELGFFPPDNQTGETNIWKRGGMNSLFYELSGATFDAGEFTTPNKSETVKASDLKAAFGVRGVDNSARRKPEIPYHGITFKPDQYKEVEGAWTDVEILQLPIKGPHNDFFKRKDGASGGINPWFYDCSTTNRHNIDSFDFWGEYTLGNRTVIISNWKE